MSWIDSMQAGVLVYRKMWSEADVTKTQRTLFCMV